MRVTRRVTTPATAVLALLLVTAVPAVAAKLITGKQIANGSLTGADIRNGSITSVDVRNGSLTGADVRNGSIGVADLKPAAKTQLTGPRGPQGEQGPSWAAAGTTAAPNSATSLNGYAPSGWRQTFTTPDAGPVLVATTVTISVNCAGTGGADACGLNYALAIDGNAVPGTTFGWTSSSDGLSSRELTLFGTMPHLVAGPHELRVMTRKVEAGNAQATIHSTPWSFMAQRIGATPTA